MKISYWSKFGIVGLFFGIMASIFYSLVHTGPISEEPPVIIGLTCYYLIFGVVAGLLFDIIFVVINKIRGSKIKLKMWQQGAVIGFIFSLLGSIIVFYFRDLELLGIFLTPLILTFVIIEKGGVLWVHLIHLLSYSLVGAFLGWFWETLLSRGISQDIKIKRLSIINIVLLILLPIIVILTIFGSSDDVLLVLSYILNIIFGIIFILSILFYGIFKKNKIIFISTIIVIILFLIVILGIVIYNLYSYNEYKKLKQQEEYFKQLASNWKIYVNYQYGFTMRYPESWENYNIINSLWNDQSLDDYINCQNNCNGPLLIFQNPKLLTEKQFRGIEIMIISHPRQGKEVSTINREKLTEKLNFIDIFGKSGENRETDFIILNNNSESNLITKEVEEIKQIIKTFDTFFIDAD